MPAIVKGKRMGRLSQHASRERSRGWAASPPFTFSAASPPYRS